MSSQKVNQSSIIRDKQRVLFSMVWSQAKQHTPLSLCYCYTQCMTVVPCVYPPHHCLTFISLDWFTFDLLGKSHIELQADFWWCHRQETADAALYVFCFVLQAWGSILGYSGFSCDLNFCDSSRYICNLHLLQSEHKDKQKWKETHCARLAHGRTHVHKHHECILFAFCFCFFFVISKASIPQSELCNWWRHYTGRYRPPISLLYNFVGDGYPAIHIKLRTSFDEKKYN